MATYVASHPPHASSKCRHIQGKDGWVTIPGKFPTSNSSIVEIPTLLVKNVGEIVNHLGKRQFLIETLVSSKGENKYPRILIDTGAQPNLVREGLFPKHLFHSSPKPLNLRAANQKKLKVELMSSLSHSISLIPT